MTNIMKKCCQNYCLLSWINRDVPKTDTSLGRIAKKYYTYDIVPLTNFFTRIIAEDLLGTKNAFKNNQTAII